MMLKTILFAFTLLFTTNFSTTTNLDTDPIGTWSYVVPNVPDVGDVEGKMVISKEGDTYEVTLTSTMGEAPLTVVKMEENQLSGEISAQGIVITLKGTFDGDAFSGTFSSDYGEFPMTAKRE